MSENIAAIDNSILRKDKNIKENLQIIDGFPCFTLVEFNIYGACNRSCSFCPVSDPDFYTNNYEGMTEELYSKIMQNLADLDYHGGLLFSAYSEPFLHPGLSGLVKITKKFIPKCRLEIVSNGDIVKKKPKLLTDLFDAGLDVCSFSMYDGTEVTDEFQKQIDALKITNGTVIFRRRYYENGNYGIIISNRTGLVDSNKYRDEKESKIETLPLKRQCFYPFYLTLIDYNGDMVLCPHDWGKKYVVGNLKDDHIWNLWVGKKYETARKLLSCKNRNFSPCDTCDIRGDVMGKGSHDAWANK